MTEPDTVVPSVEGPSIRFVAIGDSFTEGVGDELPDGSVRGWADLVAQGWADDLGAPIGYANLAIRGKLAGQILREQLEQALALHPTHLSFNGGGNDMLRARTRVDGIASAFVHVLERTDAERVQLVVLSGANPSRRLPLGQVMQQRGDLLTRAVERRLADRPDVMRAYNWPDEALTEARFWSQDRLHMNSRGHHRVAARVLETLGLDAPHRWWDLDDIEATAPLGRGRYLREHLAPWVTRRLTRTSSGDGRLPKIGDWITVEPRPATRSDARGVVGVAGVAQHEVPDDREQPQQDDGEQRAMPERPPQS